MRRAGCALREGRQGENGGRWHGQQTARAAQGVVTRMDALWAPRQRRLRLVAVRLEDDAPMR